MKKIILSAAMLLTFVLKTQAQCNVAVPLPYEENFDMAILPDLPECTYSNKQTFVGGDWETVAAPNNSFSGNVARYVTYSDAGWNMYCIYGLRPVELTAGMAYRISYKYAHDTNDTAIDQLTVGMYRSENPNIELITHEGITGTEATSYTSELFTVPENDTYYFHFDVMTSGSQGIIYLDDIRIEAMGVMSNIDRKFAQLACYPNPVKDVVTITNDTPLQQLELFNTTGQLLLAQAATEETTQLNIEHLPAGVYFLKAGSGTAVQTLKLIKQ